MSPITPYFVASAQFREDRLTFHRVIRSVRVYLPVEVMQQSRDRPRLFILPKLPGIRDDTGFDRQHVPPQAL